MSPPEQLPAPPSPSAAPPRRARVPTWLLLGLGAGAALAFGKLGAGMTFGAPLVLVGLGGLVLIWCGIILHRILRPLLDPDHVSEARGDQGAPVRRRELEREKQLVLKAIREIELDYQMKKLSESDHREMTQRYRVRAMRLLRELDAGDDYRALIEQELKARLGAQAGARDGGQS
jgi:hypothetical protein